MMETSTCLDRKIDGNNHLGHIVLECFKTRKPDDICVIIAETGEKETYESVLTRSLALARSLRRASFQPGDVLALSGRNHLNLRIPFYAGLMNGLPVAGIDPYSNYEETKKALKIVAPKIAFCEYENYEVYSQIVEELGLDTKIFTFYDGEFSMAKFVEKFDTKETGDFRPSCFDTDKVYAFLIGTSGTTGGIKFAAIKHGAAVIGQAMMVTMSPGQWVSSFYNNISYPMANTCILQSSSVVCTSTFIDIINKYKPSIIVVNPAIMSLIMKHEKHCDLSCFDFIVTGGAKLTKETYLKLKTQIREDAKIIEGYCQSETMLGILCTTGKEPIGSCGTGNGLHKFKLIDETTGAEITEPYKHGELWVKGPGCFTEYYNNPEETEKAITEDGWFKTGDVMYRDEHGNYYFVDRLKSRIRYRSACVFPNEIEEVLETHPGVLEVCVTSIPNKEDEERPMACVVRRPGCAVTAQEIKDFVAGKLSDSEQLRGGVIFLDSLPKTSSGKVSRVKVHELVRAM